MASIQAFQSQTLVYNVPFKLTYGARYIVKATNPPNQIALGIKMYYTGAQYEFNVLSGASVVLDGSIIREVQLLTQIGGVVIIEGGVNLPARDDVYNRNPTRIFQSTGSQAIPTGTDQIEMFAYTVPNVRKFEGNLYLFIGPTTTAALSGRAYEQMYLNSNMPQAYSLEANAGSVLPREIRMPLRMLQGEYVSLSWSNSSGQTLFMQMSLIGLESDV